MLRKASETHFTSDEQAVEYVRRSVAVADEANLTPEDRAVLLPSILTILSNKQVEFEQVQIGALGALGRPQG